MLPRPTPTHATTLLLLFLLGADARVQRASRRALDAVKALINEESVRQNSARQSDGVDFFVDLRRNPDARDHQNELSINNLEDYFQGDVDLSEQQVNIIAQEVKGGGRKKRKIGRTPLYKLWDRSAPISFDFDPSIPASTKAKIRDAMRLWQRHTCIRFEENGPSVDRLEFFDGGGCSSFVGRVTGTQGISIATPGCDVVGIISHEIGHSLGAFHEQARPDQERNIAVNYNNIPISRWNNFQPVGERQADVFELPYDTGSVMHYGPFGFASDPYTPTIRTLERSQQNTIGQRAGPSFLDFQAINLAYRCLEHCAPLDCRHNGYPNPNNCSNCMCPDGFTGQYCELVRASNQNCGGVIEVGHAQQQLASPQHPDRFPRNTECFWWLKAPPGAKVHLKFERDVFEFTCEDTCDKSYVEVKHHKDMRLTGSRYCCSSAPKHAFESEGEEMVVLLRGFGGAGRGFAATVWADADWPHMTTPPAPTESTTTLQKLFSLPNIFTNVVTGALSTTPQPVTESTTQTTTTAAPSTTGATLSFKPFTFAPLPPAPITPQSVSGQTVSPVQPVQPVQPVTLFPPVGLTTPSPEGSILVNDCGCGPWGEWEGPCNQECGGCGHRQRTRECQRGTCQRVEKRPCNFAACPQGTNFLINNAEFHILWRGCCVGLFRSGEQCTALETNQNPFLKIISSLLSSSDAKNQTRIREKLAHLGEH